MGNALHRITEATAVMPSSGSAYVRSGHTHRP